MPWVEGVKMACSPCIRGHRSTKCSHQGSRVMIPVRKPGRPLANCAGHAPGELCGCGRPTVVAAIPKRARCGGCGEQKLRSGSTSAPVKTERPVNPNGAIVSPTRSAFRINKVGARASSRQQSSYVTPELLARMDPSSFNLISNGSNDSNGNNGNYQNVQGPAEHGPIAFDAPQAFESPMMGAIDPALSPMYQPPFSYGMSTISPPIYNGNMDIHSAVPMMNGDFAAGPSSGTPKRTASYSSEASSVDFTPASSAASMSLEAMPTAPKRSCCAPTTLGEGGTESNDYNTMPVSSIGMHGPQQPPTTAPSPHGFYPNSINAYPQDYGTYNNPLEFGHWQAGGFYPPAQEASAQDGFAHNCNCGPGCQCIGCFAHPFNEATRELVTGVYQFQNQDSWMKQPDEVQDAMLGPSNSSPTVQDAASPLGTQSSSSEAGEAGETAEVGEAGSHLASDKEGSLTKNESTEDGYLFVRFPCFGEAASCCCGDDCACEGCEIHQQTETQIAPSEGTNAEETKDSLSRL